MNKLNFSLVLVPILAVFVGCAQKVDSDFDLVGECRSIQECTELALDQKNKITLLENENNKLKEKEPNLFPPNGKIGECYARVLTPVKYRQELMKVLVTDAQERVETTAPTYKMVDKKVLVKEAGEKIITIPAVYKMVEEKVLVRSERKEFEKVDAKYDIKSEDVLVSKSHKEWKSFSREACNNDPRCSVSNMNDLTGEIICLVKVPAKYKKITKKVILSPEDTKEKIIPAIYKIITKRVMIKPAEIRRIKIPAVYKTVRVKEIDNESKVKKFHIDAVYENVYKKIKIADETMEWKRILCINLINEIKILELQRALKNRNFYNGKIDGEYGTQTKEALKEYQQSNKLSIGALTIETLKDLNVSY